MRYAYPAWSIDYPLDPLDLLERVANEHYGVTLTLNPKSLTGSLDATYGKRSRDAVPEEIYHRRVLRIWLNDDLDATVTKQYLSQPGGVGPALLERIRRGHSTSWNGNNHVGQLDEDGQSALVELEAYLRTLRLSDIHEHAGIWDPRDWLGLVVHRDTTTETVHDGPASITLDLASPVTITRETPEEHLDRLGESIDADARQEYAILRRTRDYLGNLRDQCDHVVE